MRESGDWSNSSMPMVDLKMEIMIGPNDVINPANIKPLESSESPLSLLAKTCSNIGLDMPSRPSIAAVAKSPRESTRSPKSPEAGSPGSTSSKDRSSPRRSPLNAEPPKARSQKSKVTFKPYESTASSLERAKSRSPSAKTSSPMSVTSSLQALTSHPSMASASPRASPEEASPKPMPSILSPYGLGSPLDALYLRSGLPPSACRDPTCKGCLPGLCPTNCVQCKTLPPSGLGLGLGLYPPPGLVGGLQPYCCNWSEAGAYCGKRFNTSDELMNHLRTHTQSDPGAAASLLPPITPLPGTVLPSLPVSLHPLMSVNSASTVLSRSAFPVVHGSSGAVSARYHPYGKPGVLPSLPMPGPLALYPYLASPYLYAGLRR